MLGFSLIPRTCRPNPSHPTLSPATGATRGTRRPVEYNPPTDVYAKVICDELMPVLNKAYNISPDPDLHGICGASSGGCAAFAVAWFAARPSSTRSSPSSAVSLDIRGEYRLSRDCGGRRTKGDPGFSCMDGRNDNRTPGAPTTTGSCKNVAPMNALTKKGYERSH